MTDSGNFNLQASKLYFGISLMVHVCTLVTIWIYSFNIYISSVLSLLLVIHFQHLNQHIFLQKTDSTLSFSLAGSNIITTDKTGAKQQYPYTYCAYQSRFLVIIPIGKRSLIVFKDSLADHSLSQLNRLLNA